MKHMRFWTLYRVAAALLGFSAIVTEIVILLERGLFDAANFFSFFTVQSNIIAVIVLLLSAYVAVSGRTSHLIDVLRGAAALYMTVTGVVFAILLSGLDPTHLTAVPWDNTVLHYIMPIAVLVDWLLNRTARPVRLKTALLWLIYPVAYLIYSLIHGSIVDWYPYPFLDPATRGYVGLAIVCTIIGLFGVALTYLFSVSTRRRRINAAS